MRRIIIAIAVILFATPALCGSISEEISKTQQEIVRIKSQRRISQGMEPKGLRRNIAKKKACLEDLYFIEAGGTPEELRQRKMQKQLDRIEDRVDSIRARQNARW